VSWIDVSVALSPDLVTWPGDPKVQVSRPISIDRGHDCNVSRLDFGAHTGTHMDAPEHFIAGGATIDQMPIEATVGLARVIEIHDPKSVGASELAQYDLKAGERVLFKTKNSHRDWASAPFDEQFVHIAADGAQALVDAGVQTVGIDYLSVGAYEGDGVQTHQILLAAGLWLIEGLDLSKVQPGLCELVCLPLKVLGGEGAPARAILRPAVAEATSAAAS